MNIKRPAALLYLVIAGCAAAWMPAAQAAPTATAPASVTADGLDAVEIERALAIAAGTAWTVSDDLRSAGSANRTAIAPDGSGVTQERHPLGIQTLGLEAERRKSASPGERRARVYEYDHDTGRARRLVVDLERGTILRQTPLASVHLPLNANERRWVLDRVAGTPAVLAAVRAEQRRRNLPEAQSLAGLEVKASVYEPVETTRRCHVERCALVSMFDPRGTVFAHEPVVVFSTGEVGELGDGR